MFVDFVLSLSAIGGLVAALFGLVLLFPRSKRQLGKQMLSVGLVAFVGAVIGVAMTMNSELRAAGWSSSQERDAAAAEGVEDPVRWRQLVAEREAEAEEAHRQAAAEATRLAEEARQRSESEAREREATAAAQAREAEAAELEACLRTLACAGERASNLAVTSQCERALPHLAQYSFEFTDGWLEPKFSHYRWRSQEDGVVTIIGDRARAQNGFGAWLPVVYECDVDVRAEAIVDARLEAGRL